jgi:hypothetical protein
MVPVRRWKCTLTPLTVITVWYSLRLTATLIDKAPNSYSPSRTNPGSPIRFASLPAHRMKSSQAQCRFSTRAEVARRAPLCGIALPYLSARLPVGRPRHAKDTRNLNRRPSKCIPISRNGLSPVRVCGSDSPVRGDTHGCMWLSVNPVLTSGFRVRLAVAGSLKTA